jgi:hypothetical protein
MFHSVFVSKPSTKTAPPYSGNRAAFLTPREVERRYHDLSRRVLAKRRSLGLSPNYEVVSGCVLYRRREIEELSCKPLRCAIYARCASQTQTSSNAVGDQIAACISRAQELGWTLAQTYSDSDKSVSSMDGRRGISRLIDDANKGKFDIILVQDLARISRDPFDAYMFCRSMSEANSRIYTLEPDGFVSLQVGRVLTQSRKRTAR